MEGPGAVSKLKWAEHVSTTLRETPGPGEGGPETYAPRTAQKFWENFRLPQAGVPQTLRAGRPLCVTPWFPFLVCIRQSNSEVRRT